MLHMHLIFATSIVPDGTFGSGYEIANEAILGALKRAGCRVTVMGFSWQGRQAAAPGDAVVLGTLDPRTEAAGAARRARWLASALAHRLTFSSAKMRLVSLGAVRSAVDRLEPVDGVIFNSVQFAGAFRDAFAGKPSLYVAHNVEHLSAAQAAQAARGAVERLLFRREARLLKVLERSLCAGARFVFTLAEEDRDALGVADDDRSAVLPLVARMPAGRPRPRRTRYDAALIGTWSWAPNRIGLDWFLNEVVPRLPDGFRVAVAGDAPPALAQAHPRVLFAGRVENAVAFVRSGAVVPLISRAGTGVQLKTIEAFEQGLPSVATRSALRGIASLPENCAVADDAAAFADALVRAAGAPRDVDGRAFHEGQRAALDAALRHGLERAGLLCARQAA